MVLSVIIVNYNVKFFLEQCLCSVLGSQFLVRRSEVEVIVVDNNSKDGSVEYLKQKFPFVKFIANKENVGFAKANNQACREASGRYLSKAPTTATGDRMVRRSSLMRLMEK